MKREAAERKKEKDFIQESGRELKCFFIRESSTKLSEPIYGER